MVVKLISKTSSCIRPIELSGVQFGFQIIRVISKSIEDDTKSNYQFVKSILKSLFHKQKIVLYSYHRFRFYATIGFFHQEIIVFRLPSITDTIYGNA